MSDTLKPFVSILLSSIILLSGIFYSATLSQFFLGNEQTLQFIPILLLSLTFVLCYSFKRYELSYFLLVCLIYYSIYQYYLPSPISFSEFQSSTLLLLCTAFIPFNFIFFRMVNSFFGSKLLLLSVILLLCEVSFTFITLHYQYATVLNVLRAEFLPPFIITVEPVTHLVSILLFISLLIQTIFVISKRENLESSILLLMCGIYYPLFNIQDSSLLCISFSLGGIIVCIGLIIDSFNMAFIDPLTKLPGRRYLEQELKQLGNRYAIAMLDIDHFKKINDNYGHDVGDQVLKMISKRIRKISGGGLATRFGGEEFALIFPDKHLSEVLPHLEQIRNNIENSSFTIRSKPRPRKVPKNNKRKRSNLKNIKVTVSMGVAERDRVNRESEAVQKAADEALYKAKKSGRNKVCY